MVPNEGFGEETEGVEGVFRPISEQQCQLATLSPGLDYQPKSTGGGRSNITVAKASTYLVHKV